MLALGQRGEAQEDQRWSLYETFHGSTNSAGPVFKLDNGVPYGINDHVEVGGGLPVSCVNAGVANTVSDTAFFTRPFTSLGVGGHFEGGATVSVARYVDIGGSVYDIAPTGEQKIISKLIGRTVPVNSNRSGNAFQRSAETVGGADLAKDHGYSTWIELSKGSDINFQLGYTRSAGYDLNSVFFSVGFNVSSLIRKNRS